jgi:hypothetical protein
MKLTIKKYAKISFLLTVGVWIYYTAANFDQISTAIKNVNSIEDNNAEYERALATYKDSFGNGGNTSLLRKVCNEVQSKYYWEEKNAQKYLKKASMWYMLFLILLR